MCPSSMAPWPAFISLFNKCCMIDLSSIPYLSPAYLAFPEMLILIYNQTCEQRPPNWKMVFTDKWSLFGGYFVLFYQESYPSADFIYRMVFIGRWPLIQVWLYNRNMEIWNHQWSKKNFGILNRIFQNLIFYGPLF